MAQSADLSIEIIEELLTEMKLHSKPATIDFVNRTIRILSEPITRKDAQLSTGPMRYQNILYEINFVD